MREILFRGKRVSNGEWVYGLPMYMNYIKEFTNHTYENIQIDDKTLCQYTGVKDISGQCVFENDIIEFVDKYKRVVKYSEVKASFVTCYKDEYLGFLSDFNSNQIKVVGNIFDNPDLLQGGEE